MPIDIAAADSATSEDELLISNAFDNCHCIIIFNHKTGESQLHHVWEGAHVGLSDEQKEAAEEFLAQPGRKEAVTIEGSRAIFDPIDGTDQKIGKQQIEDMGEVTFLPDIEVNNGGQIWNISYDPESLSASITLRDGKELEPINLFERGAHQSQVEGSTSARNHLR